MILKACFQLNLPIEFTGRLRLLSHREEQLDQLGAIRKEEISGPNYGNWIAHRRLNTFSGGSVTTPLLSDGSYRGGGWTSTPDVVCATGSMRTVPIFC
jgi:hypothetical protein